MSWAVVTGASRGIGRATALELAGAGLDLALLGRPSAELSAARSEVEKRGREALVFECDVALPEQVSRASAEVLAQCGAPEVVVNNAGMVHRGPLIEETDPSDWDRVMAVNLSGPFLISRAFLPAMRLRGRGRFVFVASISSTLGCPRAASYAASKWALVGLAKSLAEELRGSQLISVAILPGSVDTAMLEGSGFEPQMSAEDIARTIRYLACDAPAAINGSAVEMFG